MLERQQFRALPQPLPKIIESIHEISLPVEELNGLRSRGVSKKVTEMSSANGGIDVSQSIMIEESKPNKMNLYDSYVTV